MKPIGLFFLGLVLAGSVRAQIPVTDIANLTANQIAHVEDIAKWAESIANLKTQVSQLGQQLNLQNDLHNWAGNPAIAFKTNGALTGRCQAKKLVSALNESARPESIGCWSRPDQASRRLGLQGALFETRPKIVMPSWVETG